jgi:hypothetical protein
MQVRSPTRQSAARIGLEPELNPGTDRDESDQLGGRHTLTATDTRSRRAGHDKVYPSWRGDAYPVSYPPRPHPGP